MNLIESLTQQATRVASDVQNSLKRARTEGERRLLLRQHRLALEELGARTYELVSSGRLPGDLMEPQVAEVEGRLMEIEAKVNEIDSLRPEAGAGADADAADPSTAAFPMVGEEDGQGDGEPAPGPGAGWDAASRFFGPNGS